MMNPARDTAEEEKGDESLQPSGSAQENNELTALTQQLPTFSDVAVAGFLDNFKLELTHVSQEIRNLTEEQNKLLDKVGEHNGVIQSHPDMTQLITVMDEMKSGMDRLSKLRHDMTVVHDRSEKLRNRAEKLESYCKDVQKKEENLVAKMDKPSGDQS